jgi:hypothetical protein
VGVGPVVVAKLVTRFLATTAQKYKMGDISKGVANTLLPTKKIYEKRLVVLLT